MREELPKRRHQITVSLHNEIMNQPVTATIGFGDDRKPLEIFLDTPKTSPMSELARDTALLISLALQYGITIEQMRAGVGRDESGKPHTIAGEALDALARFPDF